MNSKTTFRSNSVFFKFKNTIKIKRYPFLVLFLFSIFSYGQTTWTGATSTDWFNAGNWSDGIPDANDDVTIGNTANSPTIGTLGALANSISLIEGAILNVDVDGELTVELLENTMVTDAVTLFGTINNSGIVRIGTATSGGATGLFLGELTPIENPGIFNNFSGSTLEIDNTTVQSILLTESPNNALVNEGTIIIGAGVGVTTGIFLQEGTFTNESTGVIDVDNFGDGNGGFSVGTNVTVENNGIVNIGANTLTSNVDGIIVDGVFNNLTGGEININTFQNIGLNVQTQGVFNNSGTVNIDGSNTSAYGIRVWNGTTQTFNNLTGGIINIENTTTYGILSNSNATFDNDGTINIGISSTNSMNTGIENGSVFNNLSNGNITVDNCSGNYVFNFNTGNFVNDGVITVGSNTETDGFNGIGNNGTMTNSISGTITTTSYSNIGLNNQSQGGMIATFNNSGFIGIDGGTTGNDGLRVWVDAAVFNNLTSGTIEITNVEVTCLEAGAGNAGLDEDTEFNNSGTINILGIPSQTSNGIRANLGTFNHSAGVITIDNVLFPISISNTPSLFNNASSIVVTEDAPTINSRIINAADNTFVNNAGGTITGFGQINIAEFTNNGGRFIPGEPFGIINFTGNADLSNSIIDLDINGSSTAGVDYDKIQQNPFFSENMTLGGTLNLNITYTPTSNLEYIKIFEGSKVIGEFTTVNGLPATEWEILYNFPSEGDISLEFGAINSAQSGAFSDPNTWVDGIIPNINNPAIVEDGHTVTLDNNQTFEVARLQVNDAASVVIPETSAMTINNAIGTAVINSGNIDIDGLLNIADAQGAGISNSGLLNFNINSQIVINNVDETALTNTGDVMLAGLMDLDNANIGINNASTMTLDTNATLTIDFTTTSAVATASGSELINNGTVLLGTDPNTSNSLGAYGIDHIGYLVNATDGLIEISSITDAAILTPDGVIGTAGRSASFNLNDGVILNNGIMTLVSQSTANINQSDTAEQMKGKYKHVLKKRPTPNPGRDIEDIATFIQEALAALYGSGNVESDITELNGGIIAPDTIDSEAGILIFDGNEDIQNITLEIDVNGKTLKGTDYDLIAVIGDLTVGGDLNIDFNYTPTFADVITFVEADNIIGTFNTPTLPQDWYLRYDYPEQGKISLVFGDVLSLNENSIDDLVIFSESQSDKIIISGLLISETTAQLYDITGRLIKSKDLDAANTYNTLGINSLSAGTYIIKLITKLKGNRTQKIILD